MDKTKYTIGKVWNLIYILLENASQDITFHLVTLQSAMLENN